MEKNQLSTSYPSGSSTLNRPQKSKDKASVGTNTEVETLTHKTAPLVIDNSSTKTVEHKYVTQAGPAVQVSKAKPVQAAVAAQTANCDNKNFKTTVTHNVINQDNKNQGRPVAAPRSIEPHPVSRSSSIKVDIMSR